MKLIASIQNILLVLYCTQSNLNFEPSIHGNQQVLRETWLFEHWFQIRNSVKLRIFFFLGGGQIFQQTVHKITEFHSHFQLKSR